MPTTWETHHFGSVGQSPALRSSYLTGDDPHFPDATPALWIETPSTGAGLQLILRNRGALGPGSVGKVRNHRILTSPDLAADSWQPLPGQDIIPGDNLSRSIGIGPASSSAFFHAATWLEETTP